MDNDVSGLSEEDKEFLVKCEEKLKDRFTEKDEEFMKVFNREPPIPPIIENLWTHNSGRRHDNRNNRPRPYDRYGNRDRQNRNNHNYRRHNDYNDSYGPHRSRYSNY